MEKIFKKQSKKGGIYKIINLVDGKIYIGSAKEFKERARRHLISLEQGKHKNKHLQHAFNKFGTNNFVFEVVEVVEGDKLQRTSVEQKYLNEYLVNEDKWKKCYNFQKKTISQDRTCWSKTKTPEEAFEELSKINKEKWTRPGYRENYSKKIKEKWQEPEYREKVLKSRKKAYQDPEVKKRKSEALKKAWQNPEMQKKHKKAMRKVNREHGEEINKKKIKTYKKTMEKKYKENCPKIVKIVEHWEGTKQNKTKAFADANIISPNGVLYKNITNLREFCRVHSLEGRKADYSLSRVIKGERTSFKGWFKHLI